MSASVKKPVSISTKNTVPVRLGYRMPAEWEPHEATWLSWPRRGCASFPGKFEPIPACWVRLTELLSPHELVHINVYDARHEAGARRLLAASKKIRLDRVFFHRFGTEECWCRDHGPTFLVGPDGLAAVDWVFNAWGRKYPAWDLDDAIPQHAAALLDVPLFSPGIVLEGGSIDVNGCGTVLTTRSCLLNKNRNPGLTQRQIERHLKDYLGVTKVLWLGDGLVGDDTDGHVDDITRFVGPRTIVTCVEEDPADVNYRALRENLKRLQRMTDQDGRPLRIIKLPMPGRVEQDGVRLPASYANFYIANRIVLVPVYSHPNDRRALAILQRCFPSRRIVPVDSRDLIWGLGSYHCVTQQQPALGRRLFKPSIPSARNDDFGRA